MTYTILRFNRGRVVGRYLFTFLVFSVSGVFHLCCDITQGIPSLESGAMRFFILQALGIMLEDAVSAVLGRLCPRKFRNISSSLKPLGYVWVATWLMWSSPTWIYSSMRRATGEPLIPVPRQIEALFHHIYLEAIAWYYSSIETTSSSITFRSWAGILALTMVFIGMAAWLDPLKLAHNTGLSFPEDLLEDKNDKARTGVIKSQEAQSRDLAQKTSINYREP